MELLTCNPEIETFEGLTLGRALLRSNLAQVIHTCAPLSPNGIIW